MLLLMASVCSLTLIVLSISAMGKLFKVWVTRPENSAKVSCVICWSNRSRWNSRFLANLLDGDVLLVRQKRNVCLLLCTQSARKNPAWKMKFTNVHDWLLESRKTYKLIFLSSTPLLSLIFHFYEMYEMYREQIYVPALNAQNRLFQSNTILDKTTWENVFINVHYLTQQNYFQINGFAQRKPPSPVQSCFLQMLRDPAFFWRPNNTASRGRGEGKNRSATKFRKKGHPSMQFSQQFCPRLQLFVIAS